MSTWTKPFHGVTHLGDKPSRVSVTDRGTWAELMCWYPGCGFSPLRSHHDSAEIAKTLGEQWLVQQTRVPA